MPFLQNHQVYVKPGYFHILLVVVMYLRMVEQVVSAGSAAKL